MWKNLDSFLNADATLEIDSSGSISAEENIIAVLAILLRAALSDSEIGGYEVDRAVEIAAHEFQISDTRIRPLVEVAHFLAHDSKKLSSLTDNIKDTFNEVQKVEVVKAVWKILRSDSQIQKTEADFAAQLRSLLGLTLEQAIYASKRSSE